MGLLIELSPAAGRALVVGGGQVALRKVRGLVEAGFAVTVVAPEILAAVTALPGVEAEQRPFREVDLEGIALVFACTDRREVNRAVGEAARRRGIPVNVADRHEESTFASLAVHRQGALMVGVSTGGAAPAVAAEIRDRIAEALGGDWDERIAQARTARKARQERRPPGGTEGAGRRDRLR